MRAFCRLLERDLYRSWTCSHYAVGVSHEAIELGDLERLLQDLVCAFGDQVVIKRQSEVHGVKREVEFTCRG